MINKLFFLLPFFLISIGLIGQDLLSPSFGFSKKKTAYITLVDGSEINGTIKDIDRKKGFFDNFCKSRLKSYISVKILNRNVTRFINI